MKWIKGEGQDRWHVVTRIVHYRYVDIDGQEKQTDVYSTSCPDKGSWTKDHCTITDLLVWPDYNICRECEDIATIVALGGEPREKTRGQGYIPTPRKTTNEGGKSDE
jgi:hypothetical protein